MDAVRTAADEITAKYKRSHPVAKACDACVLFAVLSCLIQLTYVGLTSTFPFNSLIAGLACSTGFAVLTVCLRMRATAGSKLLDAPAPQKALGEYVFANMFLFFLVWLYMG